MFKEKGKKGSSRGVTPLHPIPSPGDRLVWPDPRALSPRRAAALKPAAWGRLCGTVPLARPLAGRRHGVQGTSPLRLPFSLLPSPFSLLPSPLPTPPTPHPHPQHGQALAIRALVGLRRRDQERHGHGKHGGSRAARLVLRQWCPPFWPSHGPPVRKARPPP